MSSVCDLSYDDHKSSDRHDTQTEDFIMNTTFYIEETNQGIQTVPLAGALLAERKIFLDDTILPETAVSFIQAMMYLTRTPEPIDIYLSSPGGEVNSGLAIYDCMRNCPNELNVYCIGMAASMAAVLLAAGPRGRRFILPHSKVMIHEVLLGQGVTGSASSISRLSDSIMETRDIVNGILAEHTGRPIEEIHQATSFDNVMNAEEAIAFGICDRIIDGIFERGNVR